MTYEVVILRKAQRELAALPRAAYTRVRAALRGLGMSPRGPGAKKLRGREAWRMREGDYRVLYEIDDDSRVVTVVHVGHRREVYR